LKRRLSAVLGSCFLVGVARAGSLTLNLEIPNLPVAEYHRPYVAVWIEAPDQTVAAHLALWYQVRGDHTKWLPDLRQWWRRGGRDVKVPVDGLTGATRPAGQHILRFDSTAEPLSKLAPGRYTLMIEAVREQGGREALRIPFEWPAKVAQRGSAQGNTELGNASLTVDP
jgi:hypothetical protein